MFHISGYWPHGKGYCTLNTTWNSDKGIVSGCNVKPNSWHTNLELLSTKLYKALYIVFLLLFVFQRTLLRLNLLAVGGRQEMIPSE